MNWFDRLTGRSTLDESIKSFANKGDGAVSPKKVDDMSGEGVENLAGSYGLVGLGSFNTFYDSNINKAFKNEQDRIRSYREMAEAPEIADVIEDSINESTMENDDGNILNFVITDGDISSNKNITETLIKEFNDLFYKKLDINNKIPDFMRSYMVDGRVFYERIIKESSPSLGIFNIKKLPAETMDYLYDRMTGKVIKYFQYLKGEHNITSATSLAQAEIDKDVIVFNPEQIGFIDYGQYGQTRKHILGYLEKAKVPYNQLKLLETSVIIYRIVRSPERLVFKIDTGNMPKDKAFKFVEKIKTRFTKKQSYNPSSGKLTQEPEILSLLENYYIPQCLRISNTYIDLLDGRKILLYDLIKEHDNGIKHEVYSVNQKSGKIIRGKVKWAGITRKNAELMRVTLDNDEYIDCTPDHKFCVWKDETRTEIIEVEAQNITTEMDLVENV